MRYAAALLALLLAFIGLIYAFNKWEDKLREDGKQTCIAEQEKAANEANSNERAKEQQRAKDQQAALEAARVQAAKSAADLVRSRNERDGLQKQLLAIRNRPASSDPAVTRERETTNTVTELFGLCNSRYTGLAGEADKAREAGLLCQSFYNSNVSPIRDAVKKIGATP